MVAALCLLALGLVLFAAACGEETTATTAAPATTMTTAAATVTTAAATMTTAASGTATTAASSEGTSGTMTVKGLVDKPQSLSADDLKKLGTKTITADHPKNGSQQYTGVLLSDLEKAVGMQAAAKTLDLGGSDGYMGEVTLSELDPNSMIAIGDDGKLNAVFPGQPGKAWVTDIISLEFK